MADDQTSQENQSARTLWVNGQWVSDGEAMVSVADQGFLRGWGLFETMLGVTGGQGAEARVPWLSPHLERLQRSADTLGLGPVDQEQLAAACLEILRLKEKQESLHHWRIRLTVTAGQTTEHWAKSSGKPTMVIDCLPMKMNKAKVDLVLSPYTLSPQRPTAGMKTTSHAAYVMAAAFALQKDCQEAILLTPQGDVIEGSSTNVFVITDQGLVTPGLESGCLPGVMRSWLIRQAENFGISVKESLVSPADFRRADAAFVCSATLGPRLVSVGGPLRPKSSKSVLFDRLRRAFEEQVS